MDKVASAATKHLCMPPQCETDNSQISGDPGEKFGYKRDENWVAMEKEGTEENYVMELEKPNK